MAYQIIKTKSFLKNVIAINRYLENEWGQKSASNFQLILDNLILLLSERPKIGSVSKKHINIRKFLVTKHNKLYYKLNDKTITLLALFDTRKNPIKMNLNNVIIFSSCCKTKNLCQQLLKQNTTLSNIKLQRAMN